MKYLILSTLLFLSISAFPQNCTETLLLTTAGKWKGGLKGFKGAGRAAPADLAREEKVVTAIHTMITSKYSPMGIEADFWAVYDFPQPNIFANGFNYKILPLDYYCDGNSIKMAHETSTHFEILANSFFTGIIYDLPNNDEATSGTGYYYILDMPVEKNGIWYFKEKEITLAFGIPGKVSRWLITYEGRLPYTYVTKKEFLEIRKKILKNALIKSAAEFKDILRNNEIDKKYKEVEYKNDPEKLKKYMKMDYLEIKARYEKLLSDNEISYDPAFAKIETQLKLPAAELDQQAIVKMDPYDHLSYLFTNDDDVFGHVLIKPNPLYFNKKIPKSSPQFFCIEILGSHKQPIPAKFMTDILKAVDFSLLKNMLGK